MTTRQFGAPIKRNEDARLLTGRAQFIDDVRLPGILHAAFVRSPHAHARIASIDASAALRQAGVVAVYTAASLGDFWQPGPMVVPPPPIEGSVFNQRTQGPIARGKVRHVGEPVAMVVATSRYLAEDAAGEVRVEWDPLPVAASLEQAATAGAPRVHDDLPDNVAAQCAADERRLRRSREGGPPRPQASLHLRPRLCHANRDARGRRAVGRGHRSPHRVGHHPGADRSPQRARAGIRTLGAPGSRGRALHRRRVRTEDHVVLSGRAAGAVGGDEARASGEVDRGPRGALLRHHARARSGARGRDRARRGRADPRREGRLPPRHRRLRPVRPDDPDQQPVHAARALRDTELRLELHRRLHPQADRHAVPRRRPPARRVRDRAAARLRSARARAGPRRDPAAKLHPAGGLPVRQRDHLPGLHAARLRQRQLRADARQGAGDRSATTLSFARSSRGCARRDGASGSVSSVTSKAPASAPTRGRRCRCTRTAR